MFVKILLLFFALITGTASTYNMYSWIKDSGENINSINPNGSYDEVDDYGFINFIYNEKADLSNGTFKASINFETLKEAKNDYYNYSLKPCLSLDDLNIDELYDTKDNLNIKNRYLVKATIYYDIIYNQQDIENLKDGDILTGPYNNLKVTNLKFNKNAIVFYDDNEFKYSKEKYTLSLDKKTNKYYLLNENNEKVIYEDYRPLFLDYENIIIIFKNKEYKGLKSFLEKNNLNYEYENCIIFIENEETTKIIIN